MLLLTSTTGHDVLCAPFHVEFAANLVLIALNKLSDHSPDHVQLFALGGWHGLSQIIKLDLSLLEFLSDLVDDVGQVVSDMCEENAGTFCSKNFTTKITGRHRGVNWMRIEECHLFLHGGLDRDLRLDVLLRSVFHSYETKAKLDFLVHNCSLGVRASIHDINLGDDTQSPDALRVDSSCHPQTLLSSHIGISGHYTENDSPGVADVPLCH